MIETDSALYIVRLDSETDKDATEKNRQNIIDKRKSDHYNEVLEGWQKKDGWKVNKKNVAKISFKNSLTQQDRSFMIYTAKRAFSYPEKAPLLIICSV